jgi:hypothetical protein
MKTWAKLETDTKVLIVIAIIDVALFCLAVYIWELWYV